MVDIVPAKRRDHFHDRRFAGCIRLATLPISNFLELDFGITTATSTGSA